jgi:hypothetical protein
MEVDDGNSEHGSLFSASGQSSPKIAAPSRPAFARIYLADPLSLPDSDSDVEITPKAKGKARAVQAQAGPSSSGVISSSSGRVTRSQAKKAIGMASQSSPSISTAPAIRIDSPEPTGPVATKIPSPVPAKRRPGRPRGSRTVKATPSRSQAENDPSHVRLMVPSTPAERPLSDELRGITRHLPEIPEVRSRFLFS